MLRRDFFAATILLSLTACQGSVENQHRIVLIGDSTVADHPHPDAHTAGWGQALRERLRTRAAVLNYAVPGSSTRRFAERHWSQVRESLVAGDLLLIQFGHIDALPDPARHTEPFGAYSELLRLFINEARAVGARPVLVTPIARYKFTNGRLVDTHGSYLIAMRNVAHDSHVPLVDLAQASGQALEQLGESRARTWFMVEHDGRDTVHLSRVGADAAANLVETALDRAGLL